MEYLQDKEVAKRLSWPVGRVKRLLFYRRENGLTSAVVKINKSLFIDFDAFLNWIEAHRESKQIVEEHKQ